MSEDLFQLIRKNKPSVKDTTIKSYVSNLRKLNKMFHEDNEKELDNIDFLKDIDKVQQTLDHLHYTTKRNYYIL